MEVKMTAEEVSAFLADVFPQMKGRYTIDAVTDDGAKVSMTAGHDELRPGGTVSGPALFTLADLAFYAAALSRVGPKALTVTTSTTINFMRRAPAGKLWSEARILKLGRTLCVGDAIIMSEHAEGPVAHASLTYAIPPPRAK